MARTPAPLDFGREDLADPVDAGPMLFDSIKVCCKDCGSPLVEKTYQFFPTTLFIKGQCLVHGARSAMFAPPVNETTTQEHERHVQEHGVCLANLPPHLKQAYDDIVNDFIRHVQKEGLPEASVVDAA